MEDVSLERLTYNIMSIPVLTQVYDELRRLAIAGSSVAAGDFRLKKLLPPLEQAGAKAPVFAKVAEAAGRLVESNEKTSAAALLEATSLVSAILYTQGETGIEGELQPVERPTSGLAKTQASARVLKPLLEALTTTGSGRMETIREAYDRGAFRDLRSISPAARRAGRHLWGDRATSSPKRFCRSTARRSCRNCRRSSIPRGDWATRGGSC